MHISVIGCGRLGAVYATAMASIGHTVIGVDIDEEKIANLAAGKTPFPEPGFDEILTASLSTGRLSFSTKHAAIAPATVHVISADAPRRSGHLAADLSDLATAFASILPHLKPGDIVVGRSGVPVGTAARLQAELDAAGTGTTLVWSPEFVRRGRSVDDTIRPNRIVFGLPTGERAATAQTILSGVYAEQLATGIPLITTDYATAELMKASTDALLATKISFVNGIADVAEAAGADIDTLLAAIEHEDTMSTTYLHAGIGFGRGVSEGIRALRARGEELGVGDALAFLRDIDGLSQGRRKKVVDLVTGALGGTIAKRRIALLGLAESSDSDDVSDSPALDIAVRLKGLGAKVRVTDPRAVPAARARHPQLKYTETAEHAMNGAEVVVLLTEWATYTALDPKAVAEIVSTRIVIDGCNALDPAAWRAAGFTYIGIG